MRKQFNQFKDFVHNNLSRNEKHDVLSPCVLQAEKHVEHIKLALTNSEKKIQNSLLSGGGVTDSSAATPERKLKKIPSSSLSVCFNEASDLLSSSKSDSVLGKTLLLCSQLHKESTSILADYESAVERDCITNIQSCINDDLPAITATRKKLHRTNTELGALRAKYDSTLKSAQGSSQLSAFSAENKLDPLRKELDENHLKLYQCRDAYETEIFDFLSKELNIAQVFCDYVKLQASYHERMLNEIQHYIPVLEGVIANSLQKPVFGVALDDHLRTSGRQISVVIESCIAHLLPSITEEGLFRISGSMSKVKLLRNAFNSGHHDALGFSPDVHAVASTLKSYLRELPEPLLTFHLYDEWIAAISEKDSQERLKLLWKVCNQLPEANKNNLRYLIKFLHEITKHCDVNKMSSQNLAIAIGPSLVWSKGGALLSMSNYSPIIIEILISNCNYFFKEDVIFKTTSKQSINDNQCSTSDNSDPENSSVSLGMKQGVYRIKKPAPKPPSQSPVPDNSTNSIENNSNSSGSETTTSKIRTKVGSLRLKPIKPNNEPSVKNHFEHQSRVDSPPATVSTFANIRRNTNFRNDNVRPRPISVYERPMVPPPNVPPRPSLTKPNESNPSDVSFNKRTINHSELSNLATNHNDDIQSGQNTIKSPVQGALSKGFYPSLDELEKIEKTSFSYPCDEYIDEGKPINDYDIAANSDTDLWECDIESEDRRSPGPPPKPPRSALTSTNSGDNSSHNDLHGASQTETTPTAPSPNYNEVPVGSLLSLDSPVQLSTFSNENLSQSYSTKVPIEKTYL